MFWPTGESLESSAIGLLLVGVSWLKVSQFLENSECFRLLRGVTWLRLSGSNSADPEISFYTQIDNNKNRLARLQYKIYL
jgi:hypothetical protein